MRSVLDAALHTGEDMGAEMPAKIRVKPPDLAVEIRSASNWRYDLGAKKAGYERLGLPELWLVDTSRRTVLVYRRSGPDGAVYDPAEELGGSDELTSPQPAGFAVRVDLLLFP